MAFIPDSQFKEEEFSPGMLDEPKQQERKPLPRYAGPREAAEFWGTTLGNVPGSAARFASNIYQAVRHPMQTIKGVGGIAVGGVQKLIPGEQAQEHKFDQLVDFYKERYGGLSNAMYTLQEDPAGFAADLASVLYGVGGAVRGAGMATTKVGTVAHAGKVATAGQAMQRFGTSAQRAGLAVEPIHVAAKGARVAAKVPGEIAKHTLGITTGQGVEVINQAMKASRTTARPEYVAALRGQTDKSHLLTVAREGLQTIKDQRAANYTAQLGKIKTTTRPLTSQQIAPIQKAISDGLKKYNVKVGKGGKLDFSKSTIADVTEAHRIQRVITEARMWKDNTPAGLDILKRRLDDFYTPSGQGRALTNSISGSVRKTLYDNVPGYKKMTQDYAKQTALIKDIEKTLSLGDKVTTDATLRKLISALKQDVGIRNELLRYIDDLTGTNLQAQLAGAALSPGVPTGLIGRGVLAGAAGSMLAGLLSPKFLITLLGASPRLVGEFIGALGFTQQQVAKIMQLAVPEARIGAFQAGRAVKELMEPESIFETNKKSEIAPDEEWGGFIPD